MASSQLSMVTFLVRDYDEAIAYFTGALGFTLVEDTPLSSTKRWVVVAPPGSQGARLLLAQAASDEQARYIGLQAGGRVAFFWETEDFDADYAAMKARGVRFLEEPRDEAYGRVVVFADLYGNRWDFIQRGYAAPKP